MDETRKRAYFLMRSYDLGLSPREIKDILVTANLQALEELLQFSDQNKPAQRKPLGTTVLNFIVREYGSEGVKIAFQHYDPQRHNDLDFLCGTIGDNHSRYQRPARNSSIRLKTPTQIHLQPALS